MQDYTRMNPPRILDPIITTLASYYQSPRCLQPLDPDPGCSGKPSDHKMVLMTPISNINNNPGRIIKQVSFRPITELGLQQMRLWLNNEDWRELSYEKSAHKKAELLQNYLVEKYEEFFPEKTKKVCIDDQPFFNQKLMQLKRKKCREYRKHRRSYKWKTLNTAYTKEILIAKKQFYRNKIKNLRKSKPGNWYRE